MRVLSLSTGYVVIKKVDGGSMTPAVILECSRRADEGSTLKAKLRSVAHEQASLSVTSVPTTSIGRHFPASVLLQEQRDDCKSSSLNITREERTRQAASHRRQMESLEAKDSYNTDLYLKDFEHQLLYLPGDLHMKTTEKDMDNTICNKQDPDMQCSSVPVSPWDVIALAERAVVASKEAACLSRSADDILSDLESQQLSVEISTTEPVIKSTRLLERRVKKRKVPKKQNDIVHEFHNARVPYSKKKNSYKTSDADDPLGLFLGDPETRQLLTEKEETVLFSQIQDLMRLEEVKRKLQSHFDREPALNEWAQAVGVSCRMLQSRLQTGNRCREKMIYANFRLVVHVAKHYQGQGLNIQDLLQEGSVGLMRGLEKFKPHSGCRFATYAYWWIRQAIRKAIFQKSRTIRLPENVFAVLRRIKNVRNACFQGQYPSNKELAQRVGITVEKLERVFVSTKTPLSIERPVWTDQDATFQEITADPNTESNEIIVTKQLMRRHVRNLLSTLAPRERQIICFRYGIDDGERRSLSDIGSIFRLSKERVRQVESRALNKLKKSLSSQGLEAYTNLLI